MNIIDIAYGLTAPVEAVMFFMMADAFFEKRKRFPIWQYALGIGILATFLKFVNDHFLFRVGNAAGMIIVAIVVGFYFYHASLIKWIFISFFGWVIFVSTEMTVLFLNSLIFDITINEAIGIPAYLVLGIIVSKTFAFAFCYAVWVKRRSNQFELGSAYWFLFIVLFVSAVIASFMIFRMLKELNDPSYSVMAMFSSIGLYVSTFLALYLYERSVRQNQTIRLQEQAEQQMRNQLKHLDEIILKQNELRRIRHDMNGHFTALKGYFDAEDIQGGKQYLGKLIDQFQQTKPTIQTGNTPLDAILNAKKSLAESKGIQFQTTIRVQKTLPIEPQDLCIIFGNALDNAIEACERLPENMEKRIDMTLMEETQVLFCKIVNTAPPRSDHIFATSKADSVNHGFGLNNIREALAKYDAILKIDQEDDLFILKFSIFLNTR